MEKILQMLEENYIWVIVAGIFIFFTIIGYFVDRKQNKKKKLKQEKINEKELESYKTTSEEIQPNYAQNNIEIPTTTSENSEPEEDMNNTFIKEENYDLNSLLKSKEDIELPNESENEEISKENADEMKSETSVTEEPKENIYDRNLEYLLKEKEEPKEEIESIDDFLQRTMREAYHPTEEGNTELSSENEKDETDYEDTLPIPIQKEEFSPVEVTVVDPEYSRSSEKTEESSGNKQNINFKPIEDAILESLGKLSETEEKKEE